MEYQKIIKLLGKTIDPTKLPKYTTRKWIETFDQSNKIYNQNKDIRFKIPQLRSDLCDFNDAYIVVTGKITAANPNNDNNIYDRRLAFKNNASFFSSVLKINNQLVEDAQDLDVVMIMYNLLYYSKNYRKTTGSFWNYYRDEPNSGYNNDNNARTKIFYPIKNAESFNYKTKLVGKLPNGRNDLENIKIVVPLKHLSKFIFGLDTLLINSEIESILKWSQNCVLTSKATRTRKPAETGPLVLAEVPVTDSPSDLKLNVTECKLYAPVVTLQAEYEYKLYEELKAGFSVVIIWNKYRPQMINQPATNNLNYLIDPTFNNADRLFVLSFENEEDRSSFSNYYTPTVEIKGYKTLIDQQPFYEIFTTGSLLDYKYFSTQYKLIAIDLNKQKTDLENQQINFIGKLEHDTTIFLSLKKNIKPG